MLSLEQLKDIKEMERNTSDPVLRARWSKILRLPKELQTHIFSDELYKAVMRLAQKRNFRPFQSNYLVSLVITVLIGEIGTDKILGLLKDECVLEETEAKSLMEEIIKNIFYPLKDLLEQAHGLAFINALRALAGDKELPSTPAMPPNPNRPSLNQLPPQSNSPHKFSFPPVGGNVVNLRDLPRE